MKEEEKVYQFNEYILGYDKGLNDRSCLTISKILNGNMYVMSSLYDGSADVISMMLDDLQQELKYQKEAEKEYNEKHTKLMKKYKDLQQRINKAIEYLEQPNRDNFDYSKAQLIQILEGSD